MIFRMTALIVAMGALVLAGCSKKDAATDSATPKSVSLGVVELSDGAPSRQDLGDGAVCVLTATKMDQISFELIAVLERAGKKVASTRVAPAMADKPLELSFGSIRIGLVPHMR
jgi:hypothetical protein